MNPKKGKIILNENPNLEFYINRLSYYVSQQKFLINETIFKNIVMKDDVSLYENLSIEGKDLFNKSIKFSGVEEIINSKKRRNILLCRGRRIIIIRRSKTKSFYSKSYIL